MNYEYNKLLKFLYFEGYADSYREKHNDARGVKKRRGVK